jgi:hypothetical protein
MKRAGNLYEQIFFAEALSKDLEVFTPLGDYLPQDCLVMNKAGKVFKTQIKGTADNNTELARDGVEPPPPPMAWIASVLARDSESHATRLR